MCLETEGVGEIPAPFRGKSNAGGFTPRLHGDRDGLGLTDQVAHVELRLPFDAIAPDLPRVAEEGIDVGFGRRVEGVLDVEFHDAGGVAIGAVADADLVLPPDARADIPALEPAVAGECVIGHEVRAPFALFGGDHAFGGDEGGEGNNIDSRSDGSAKQGIENFLSEKLGEIWKLWKDRGNLRSAFLGDLFNLRNGIFNISSASQRKIIKPRYEKNMKALDDLLAYTKASKIPVILYIAPVRQDKLLPYDQREYSQWKEQVQQLAKVYSATYLNYEGLVPSENWGSNFGEDIDFMHFQEAGHKIVAEEILSALQSRVK